MGSLQFTVDYTLLRKSIHITSVPLPDHNGEISSNRVDLSACVPHYISAFSRVVLRPARAQISATHGADRQAHLFCDDCGECEDEDLAIGVRDLHSHTAVGVDGRRCCNIRFVLCLHLRYIDAEESHLAGNHIGYLLFKRHANGCGFR